MTKKIMKWEGRWILLRVGLEEVLLEAVLLDGDTFWVSPSRDILISDSSLKDENIIAAGRIR